jgi:DNA-binding transcriptional ArsR family regulator
MSFEDRRERGEQADGQPSSAQAGGEAAASRPIYQVKAEFFKTLGHPARIRVLELLRDGECSVGELIPGVGIEASHLSQQLGILRRANILQVRRDGGAVRYSVTDARIFELLEVARAILTSSLAESSQLLAQLQMPESGEPGHSPGRTGTG